MLVGLKLVEGERVSAEPVNHEFDREINGALAAQGLHTAIELF